MNIKNKRILNLVQGTADWHQHRGKSFNASEAAAMLGISPYKSRSDLLREMATGETKEVDAATQRRFDDGHRYEAMVRPWAEEIIGEELFPATLAADVDGMPLSSSLDGSTMMDEVTFEHKTLNQSLADSLDAGVIPDHHKPQMEQGLMISGAGKCLFMASAGDRETMRHAWYESDPKVRQQVLSGWTQFSEDLANYQHTESKPEPVAAPQETLPAVSVQVSGEISITDNLEKFGTALEAYTSRLNLKPETDQEFVDLDAASKALKKAEGALTAAEDGALAQTTSIDEMRRAVAKYRDLARSFRLKAENAVKSEKENRRAAIRQNAIDAIRKHYDSINATFDNITLGVPADFGANVAQAMKGKRTIASLQDAADTTLANAKIEANQTADVIRANLKQMDELAADLRFLFNDLQAIAGKPAEDFTALVKSRIADHKAAEETRLDQERARIRQEEERKARERAEQEKREQERKEAAEKQAQAQKEAQAQADEQRHRHEQEESERRAKGKCDGNHGGNPCGDHECWISSAKDADPQPEPAAQAPAKPVIITSPLLRSVVKVWAQKNGEIRMEMSDGRNYTMSAEEAERLRDSLDAAIQQARRAA